MFTLGGCFYAAIILLPQRFQTVNGIPAQMAGINILPFTLVSPVFSTRCGLLLGTVHKSVVSMLALSSILTVVGTAILGNLSTSLTPERDVYGFEVILGVGLGSMMPPLFFFIKADYDDSDLCMDIPRPMLINS